MRRCQHGLYWPEGHPIAFSCQACNPVITTEDAPPNSAPILMHRSALRARENGPLPGCECGGMPVRTTGRCMKCDKPVFEVAPAGMRMRANRREPGECPECGSRVHYEGKDKRVWVCADCDAEFPAPSRALQKAA